MLIPHLYLRRIIELEADYLQNLGIDGLLLDVDGTLKRYRDPEIGPEVLAWISAIQDAGIRICMLSNGRRPRISRLAAALQLPYVARAFKPFPFGCRAALKLLDLPASRVAVAGDQIFADIIAGRLSGLHTVLITPPDFDEPWFTRLKRPLEQVLVRRLRYGIPVHDPVITESPAPPETSVPLP